MEIIKKYPVLDATDIEAESTFWAAVLGGTVERGMVNHEEVDWHTVVVEGREELGIQWSPTHQPPQWPSGDQQQQIHLDLYVERDALDATHKEVVQLGATLLQAAEDLHSPMGFQVYADPAGHPFCLCWAEPQA